MLLCFCCAFAGLLLGFCWAFAGLLLCFCWACWACWAFAGLAGLAGLLPLSMYMPYRKPHGAGGYHSTAWQLLYICPSRSGIQSLGHHHTNRHHLIYRLACICSVPSTPGSGSPGGGSGDGLGCGCYSYGNVLPPASHWFCGIAMLGPASWWPFAFSFWYIIAFRA